MLALDVCNSSLFWPSSLFQPRTLTLPSLSKHQLQTPDSYTRVHRPFPHVRTPISTLFRLPTFLKHTSSTHLKRNANESRKGKVSEAAKASKAAKASEASGQSRAKRGFVSLQGVQVRAGRVEWGGRGEGGEGEWRECEKYFQLFRILDSSHPRQFSPPCSQSPSLQPQAGQWQQHRQPLTMLCLLHTIPTTPTTATMVATSIWTSTTSVFACCGGG